VPEDAIMAATKMSRPIPIQRAIVWGLMIILSAHSP
jgi:hypothetical protein